MKESSTEWLDKAIQTVGQVISFWGYKENHGKIWALLYLQNTTLSTSDIRNKLDLSKGAASMLLQDLEDWNVIIRIDNQTDRERLYGANNNFIEMITLVLERRETDIITHTLSTLDEIIAEATQANASLEQLTALEKMRSLGKLMQEVVLLGKKLQHKNIDELRTLLQTLNAIL